MIGTLLLNRYKLLEKIGEGGMGIVYKAKCTLLNRFVAVKILKAELSDDKDFITRFKREANSIASLSNPNIVNIYDVGSENNINFIVMEYINGKTLKQVINENVRLSSLKSLDIAFQIAKALQYAHKNNIIHRDIKPDNILITEDNIVKLTDFGIAKVADSVTITNSNKIIGSVHYFSPEQAKGKFVDCRTDIYALGVVMYEMITGQVPFNAETSISVAIMHIQEPVIPSNEIITDIPENINTVILKALEKEPINRFQTAKELAEILNAIKENSNLEVNFNEKSIDSTTVIMMPDVTLSDIQIGSTVVMNQETIPETIIIKKDKKVLSKNNSISKNKKIFLTIGLIILAIIIGILGKYLSKGPSTDTKATTSEITIPEESVKLPEDENKLVPSLSRMTQDVAKNTIVNNGFLLGNIITEYSDTVPKGLIINQSPASDTYYEKNGKIDLVISQGQKVTQIVPQVRGNVNGNGNEKDKDKDKKVKNKK
ncbi:MAG: Stk1 family PASTA domain-containing Ser/Thr kinase [Clostridium sp.]|uniref:Stk1 family PASTA domain-containing Ser/Thr kinase n=1 Tax=Clostridium sp. TaxID=1506 RepID=UPI0025C3F682|nr:Stk1 family PASTA domain-containing Ser/Thr kinase [Clostridium sp.]MCE5221673.1 Stk1 family PASTA domain-containing Ser/Thr kinase [Clostridium sp.]